MRASRESWSAAIQKAVKMIQQVESLRVDTEKSKDHDKVVDSLDSLGLTYFRGYLPAKESLLENKLEFLVRIVRSENPEGQPLYTYVPHNLDCSFY